MIIYSFEARKTSFQNTNTRVFHYIFSFIAFFNKATKQKDAVPPTAKKQHTDFTRKVLKIFNIFEMHYLINLKNDSADL